MPRCPPTRSTSTCPCPVSSRPAYGPGAWKNSPSADSFPGVRQLTTLGGRARPIRLDGYRTEVDTATGLTLRHLDCREMPAGCLLVRCGNRHTTRCPSCAETYRHAEVYAHVRLWLQHQAIEALGQALNDGDDPNDPPLAAATAH